MQRAVMFVHRGDDGLHIPGNMGWLAAWNRCGLHVLSGCFVYASFNVQRAGCNVRWGSKASTSSCVCSTQAAV